MAYVRSSFGKRGGPVMAGARARMRTAESGSASAATAAPAPDVAMESLQSLSVKSLLVGEDLGFKDFQTQRAAWICGGIVALLAMAVVLQFGFVFGTLIRRHNMIAETLSGFVLFATAGLAMLAAVYGGSMMAEAGRRHDLRFALLLLVFAAELILFLVGEAIGKPKGVTWLLFGALVAGFGLWARLRYDRLLSNVADLTTDLD
ncbi:MAG TPA: hypothetical protein VGI89_09665 [Rhizomicrobium sp.]